MHAYGSQTHKRDRNGPGLQVLVSSDFSWLAGKGIKMETSLKPIILSEPMLIFGIELFVDSPSAEDSQV